MTKIEREDMDNDKKLAPRLMEGVKEVMGNIPPWVMWTILGLALLYGLSPIDILPDFLPFGLGFVDDGGVGLVSILAVVLHLFSRAKTAKTAKSGSGTGSDTDIGYIYEN